MRQPPSPLRVERIANYEAFEDRLVLSAHSLGDWQPLETSLAELQPFAAAEPAPQYGALSPGTDDGRAWAADLAYVRERYGLTGQGQTVAVIDSGIAYDHRALGGGFGSGRRVVGGFDFTEEHDADPYDDGPAGFHGTHVAGVIGSSDVTHPGVAPAVDFVALRVFDDLGGGSFDWLEDALQWVHEQRLSFAHPITTINLSLGANLQPGDLPPWDLVEDEFARLRDDGIFIAVAAGNAFNPSAGGRHLSYPASSEFVVPVASLDSDGQLSDFSQRDPRVIAAPGERVTSTVPPHLFGGGNNNFAYAHGTSMATPFVAGASVLVREAMQRAGSTDIDQAAIAEHLRDTSDSLLDTSDGQTYHKINLRRAIDSLLAESPGVAGYQLSPDGRTAIIAGSSGDDAFEFFAEQRRVLVGGREISLASLGNAVETIQITAGAGRDTIVWHGGAADESLAAYGGAVQIDGGRFKLDISGAEVLIAEAGGGFDQARLTDSPRDDTFTAGPNEATLAGSDWKMTVRGFDRVSASATAGGSDVANFSDSPGGDRFYGQPERATLSGNGFSIEALGFPRVYVFAEQGGADEARFFDSAGNDRFYGRPERSEMSGQGFYHQARGFSRVYAEATIGGSDQAFLSDSPGNDRFHARGTQATMNGPGWFASVRGFDRVEARADAGGDDRATFEDSPFADRFSSQPTFASMNGQGYYNLAHGFDRVHAASTAGNDTATLLGSFRDEVLEARTGQVELIGGSFRASAERFSQIAVEGGGGIDRAVFYEVGRGDSFLGRGSRASLAGDRGRQSLLDFAEVRLLGEAIAADVDALDYVFDQAGR